MSLISSSSHETKTRGWGFGQELLCLFILKLTTLLTHYSILPEPWHVMLWFILSPCICCQAPCTHIIVSVHSRNSCEALDEWCWITCHWVVSTAAANGFQNSAQYFDWVLHQVDLWFSSHVQAVNPLMIVDTPAITTCEQCKYYWGTVTDKMLQLATAAEIHLTKEHEAPQGVMTSIQKVCEIINDTRQTKL